MQRQKISFPIQSLDLLLEDLQQVFRFNLHLIADVGGTLEELQQDLISLKGLMMEISTDNYESEYIKHLAEEISGILGEGEIAIGTFMVESAAQKKLKGWISRAFHRVAGYPTDLLDLKKKIAFFAENVKLINQENMKNSFEELRYNQARPIFTRKPPTKAVEEYPSQSASRIDLKSHIKSLAGASSGDLFTVWPMAGMAESIERNKGRYLEPYPKEKQGQIPNGIKQRDIPRYPPYSKDATVLESIINSKLSVLAPHSLNYGVVCIYKVPEKHRKKNPEAYTPRLVSIGPLHYGQSQLQRTEEYKLKYLNSFLHNFRVPLGSLTEFVHAQEKLVHGCYENNYVSNLKKPGKDDVRLSEVMLLDGVFIIELFLKNHFRELREMGDLIFDNPWVSKDILHDLLLLENQLPLKFVSSMYESFVHGNLIKFLENGALGAPSFLDLVLQYFRDVGNTRKLVLTSKSYSAQHLVEFLATLHMGPEGSQTQNTNCVYEQKLHGKDGWAQHRLGQKHGEKFDFTYCPTVKELATAGVKFKPAKKDEEKYLFDVRFDKVTGDLNIPPIVINDSTETFLRNLIAFEQTGYHSKSITSYVILLDNFINTGKDVQILIEKGIIKNELGTNDQVADIFNSLYKEVVTDPREFPFLDTCYDLNEYSKSKWHTFISRCANAIAILRRDYFNSPWSIISVTGAVFVIILTTIQTVCSLIALKKPS